MGYVEKVHQKREELESKLSSKPQACPYCEQVLEWGYMIRPRRFYWGRELNKMGGLKNGTRSGKVFKGLTHVPSFWCEVCGVLIAQLE